MNKRLSVLGLGNMGSALASTLLKSNGELVVWNRTTSKASALVSAGAKLARRAADAVAESDIAIVCVTNYGDTRAMLADCGDLSGRTLVQLSTGTSAQAESMQQWANGKGADYLDGVIIAYPSDIGQSDARLLVAGSKSAWEASRWALLQLGGASRYVGTNLAAPPALEWALTGASLMAIMAIIQGALLVEQAGVHVAILSELIPGTAPMLVKSMQRQADAIAQNRFGQPEATLGIWAAGIGTHADEDPDIDLLRPIRELLRRAIDAGYGEEEIGAVIKVMRATTR